MSVAVSLRASFEEDHIGDNMEYKVGVSAVTPPLHERECTLSIASENSSVCRDEFFSLEDNSDFRTRSSMDIDKNISFVKVVVRAAVFDDSNVEADIMSESLALGSSLGDETVVRSVLIPATTVLHQLLLEKWVSGTVGRGVFELDYTFVSLRNNR
ncbi:unnamed protein product [Vicia faba]|uniref:Uncharacterized protein n=1 Tax=Vicia faba TaxID=3906 RepID=A0AAV1AH81_VICFA|nr:unnamed protein product [Vicia faba]